MSASAEPRETEGARRRQLVAAVIAVGLHGLLLIGMSRLHGTAAVPDTNVLVEIFEQPLAAPSREDPPLDQEMRQSSRPRNRGLRRPPEKPSETPRREEPAVPPDDEGPAGVPFDLTGEMPVSGTSARGAGMGAGKDETSASGRGIGGIGHETGLPSDGRGPASDGSTTVSLEGQSWSCPWPSEADAERIDEQTVVIRVLVDPDGSVESAELVVDPGHGFGKAAVACALQTRFTPAHDRAGKACRARSPPIRVRFTR